MPDHPIPRRIPGRPVTAHVAMAHVAALAGALLLGAPAPIARAAPARQAPPACTWVRLTTGEPRMQHAMAGQPGVGALLFGGADPEAETVTDDVWRLDLTREPGGTWTRLAPAPGGTGPGPRAEHSAVLRAPEPGFPAELVTFGGIDTVPAGGTSTWRSPLVGGGYAPGAGAVRHAIPGSRLGAFAAVTVTGTTFRLRADAEAAAWLAVGAEGGPALTDHGAVYAPDSDAMVVFGGRTGEAADTASGRVWRLDLASGAWEGRDIQGGPGPRFAHSAVYDGAARRMVVFGGTRDWVTALDDVWALDLAGGWGAAAWARLDPAGLAPEPRYDHGAVYLPHLRWMLVYGGSLDGKNEVDTLYALDLGAAPPRWIEIQPPGKRPEAVKGLAAAYDAATNTAVFHGGTKGAETTRTTWGLRCGDGTSPTAFPTGSGTPTGGATATTPGPNTATPPPGGVYLPRLLRAEP
ncbi:hypothetical protein DCC79_04345 [bacterium]|nr:MAG: hypothetical protein DCC79_04345 [bacterium]